jgi:PAS domain S-box-containing protein
MLSDPGSFADAVIVTDPDGRITFWNQAAERLYGWEQAEVLGRHILDVTPATDAIDRAAEIMTSLRAGQSWAGHFRVRHKDGHWFEVHVTDVLVRDEDGKLRSIIGVSFPVD